MPVIAGTTLYAICRFSSTPVTVDSQAVVNSGKVNVGEQGDVFWEQSSVNPISPTASSVNSEPVILDPDSKDVLQYNTSFINDIAKESLRIEVWRCFMGIFDTKIATTDVNIIPLLENPDVFIERWFQLTSFNSNGIDEKSNFGNILLRFYCSPASAKRSYLGMRNPPKPAVKLDTTASANANAIDSNTNNHTSNSLESENSSASSANVVNSYNETDHSEDLQKTESIMFLPNDMDSFGIAGDEIRHKIIQEHYDDHINSHEDAEAHSNDTGNLHLSLSNVESNVFDVRNIWQLE